MLQDIKIVAEFNSMGEIRDYLENAIRIVDLSLHASPFLQTFYHPLRARTFKNFNALKQQGLTRIERNKILYQFIQIVDEEMLNMFQMQLSQPYQELVMTKHYGIPRELNVEKMQKEGKTCNSNVYKNKLVLALQNLVSNIAEWNIQIERAVDSIARVQLYDLWHPQHKEQEVQLTAELKALLSPSNDFNYAVSYL